MITAHVYKARVRVDSRFESGLAEIEAHAIGRGDHVVLQARGVVDSVAAQRRQSAQSRQRDSIVRPSHVRGRVTVVEPARNGHQFRIRSSTLPENTRYVFVQSDVLNLRHHQSSSLQEQLSVVPMLVGVGQRLGQTIVLAQKGGVHHSKRLVQAAVAHLAGRNVDPSSIVRPDSVQLFVGGSVNVGTVQICRRTVHLFPAFEITLVHSESRHGPPITYTSVLLVAAVVTFWMPRFPYGAT